MRRVILLLASVATLVTVVSSAQARPAAQDKYCLQGRHWGVPGNCQFATRPQCLAAAAGTDAFCGVNPRYAFTRRQQRR